jgi:inosine-uridine nucleoside N-ribohydrolase
MWYNNEFNLRQDIAAARVVFQSGAPLVILPAQQVTSALQATGPELEYWLRGKNALCDYLVQHTVDEVKSYAEGRAWSRVIWDVAAIAYVLNEDRHFLRSRLMPTPLPGYDHRWHFPEGTPLCRYVYYVSRDDVFTDMFAKLAK